MKLVDIEKYQEYILNRLITSHYSSKEELLEKLEPLCQEFDRLENYYKDMNDLNESSRWMDQFEDWMENEREKPARDILLKMVEMESLRSEHIKEGMLHGKKGGRPLRSAQFENDVKQMERDGVRIVDIVKKTGLSRSTVNRILGKQK